jgi:hypothetical protein
MSAFREMGRVRGECQIAYWQGGQALFAPLPASNLPPQIIKPYPLNKGQGFIGWGGRIRKLQLNLPFVPQTP